MLILGSHILHLDNKVYRDIWYVLCDYPQPHSDGTRSAISGKESALLLVFQVHFYFMAKAYCQWYTPIRLQGQNWDMPCTEWKGIWWLRIPMLNTEVPILVFAIFDRVKKELEGF